MLSLWKNRYDLIGCYRGWVIVENETLTVKSSSEANIWFDRLVDIGRWFPTVPQLCRKLMNFLWIVYCVSRSPNAELGFNDLSLLFGSMLLLHPHLILQICCVALCVSSTHWSLFLCSFSSFLHTGMVSVFVPLWLAVGGELLFLSHSCSEVSPKFTTSPGRADHPNPILQRPTLRSSAGAVLFI